MKDKCPIEAIQHFFIAHNFHPHVSGMDDYREHWLDGSPHHGVPWCATFPRRDPNAPAVSLMAGVEGFCLRDYEDMASQALTLCEFEGEDLIRVLGRNLLT